MTAGRYLAEDPAGWEYGVPNFYTGDEEREGHRVEIETRVAQMVAKRPELTEAQAEHLIRERDRDWAEKFLANMGKHDLAAVVGRVIGRSDW